MTLPPPLVAFLSILVGMLFMTYLCHLWEARKARDRRLPPEIPEEGETDTKIPEESSETLEEIPTSLPDRPHAVSTIQTSSGEIHVQPFSEKQDNLFVRLRKESPDAMRGLFVGKYQYTGQWFYCRIRSIDIDDSYTIVWEDGLLQIGTPSSSLKRIQNRQQEEEIEDKLKVMRKRYLYHEQNGTSAFEASTARANVEPPTYNGLTVWEAARQGDLETCLTLIDRGDATPNDVELIGDLSNEQGRTPLYWACFTGNTELVRQLLSRGGEDTDGTAYIAVTSQERANDNRDLMFDPDTNTFSDWVDYGAEEKSTEATTPSTTAASTATCSGDTTTLIRAMLVASKASTRRNGNAALPARLYQSTDDAKNCVVCWSARASAIPVPCGHVACCTPCLESLFHKNEDCPICRSRIRAIVPVVLSPSDQQRPSQPPPTSFAAS